MLDDRDAYVRHGEFLRPMGVINFTTGEWMPFEGEVHEDDVNWLVWMLNEGWALDWKLRQAELAGIEG